MQVGAGFTSGLAAGIAAGGKVAIATAQGVANKITAAVKSAHKSQSPSRVAIALGEFFSHGLAVGIESGGKKAIAAVKTLAAAMITKLDGLKTAAAGIASAASDSVKGVLDVTQVGAKIDTTTPGRRSRGVRSLTRSPAR